MCNDRKLVISLNGVGKSYKRFSRPMWRAFDALGWKVSESRYDVFSAVHDVTFDIVQGERVGLVGRNGAGKSTLLRIISGQTFADEGSVMVDGKIQALMELGTGFHPEFSGLHNIQSFLNMQGIEKEKQAELIENIIEFSELSKFINRPVREYSAGMYARLAFSVATAVTPEILIIDEVLGVGDAFFLGKCIDRMVEMTSNSQVTVLFVSHDMALAQRLCDRMIWVDNGKIVNDDAALNVSRAYYKSVMEEASKRVHNEDDAIATTGKYSGYKIRSVKFIDSSGKSVTSLIEGEPLTVLIDYSSNGAVADAVVAYTIYTEDGILVHHANTALVENSNQAHVRNGESVRFSYEHFLVGAGDFVVSASIFYSFDPMKYVTQPRSYDQHDRAYHLKVWKKEPGQMQLGMVRMPYSVEIL